MAVDLCKFTGLFGLAAVVMLLKAMLSLGNPDVAICFDVPHLSLGEQLCVRIATSGDMQCLNRLVVSMVGTEKSIRDDASGRHWFSNEFGELELMNLDLSSGAHQPPQTVTLSVPAKTMHSFSADNSSIKWKLRMCGDIAGGPDIFKELDVYVAPQAAEAIL